MRLEDATAWFEDLLKRSDIGQKGRRSTGFGWIGEHGSQMEMMPCFEEAAARAWVTEAGSGLAAVFPVNHPTRTAWDAMLAATPADDIDRHYPSFVGVFMGAVRQVQDGRLGTIADSIRSETEGELLDQAETLHSKGYLQAATVIAGGALETHLKNLCNKHGLTITGNGSISAYNQAVAQARKAGNEVYSANMGKDVEAWGGKRNDAAHDPGNFKWAAEDVIRMIEGIRHFITRTT